ncbi:TetR/AcrR family transcriptional regulator [Microbacterium karelineae]|uniref:TetR/AcrR family transcriptional regulator n=1 Tax=Microbacterium karelineae TaxID=2654283 RepID=UPI0012EA33BB|nr:TetR/AcrR family transcriptional regulator [Microbacterium karelineae]
MTERSYHHGDLRAALLARAVDEVDARGAEGLSLRGLARDLGVSHGASARHFRDRAALLDAVAIEGFERLLRAMQEASEADPITTAARAYIAFAIAHPGLLAASFAAKRAEDPSHALREAGQGVLDFVVALLARGQEAGIVRDGDPEELARIAFAMVHGIAMLAVDGMLYGVAPGQATDEVIAFLAEGLGAARA